MANEKRNEKAFTIYFLRESCKLQVNTRFAAFLQKRYSIEVYKL